MALFKNKKGNIFFSLIIAVIIFMVGMIAVNFIKTEVTSTYSQLNCADTNNITDGTKLLCLLTDSTVPYFIVLVFSIALGVITEKLLI